MIEIIEARSRRDRRAFFELSKTCGYSQSECEYIKRYFVNFASNVYYLLYKRDGKPTARLLTWYDEGFNKALETKQAFFSLLDGDEAAYGALIDRAVQMHKQNGMTELKGPVSPDGSGCFMGQCDRPCAVTGELTGRGDSGQTQALINAGFEKLDEYVAFRLEVPKENRYAKAAAVFSQRLSLTVSPVNRGIFNSNITQAIWQLSDEKRRYAMARQSERLMPYIEKSHSFVVSDKTGDFLGYAISLNGRIATIITKEGENRRVTALLLASALADSYIKSGDKTVELSVINVKNTASIALIRGTGAAYERSYILYNKKIT